MPSKLWRRPFTQRSVGSGPISQRQIFSRFGDHSCIGRLIKRQLLKFRDICLNVRVDDRGGLASARSAPSGLGSFFEQSQGWLAFSDGVEGVSGTWAMVPTYNFGLSLFPAKQKARGERPARQSCDDRTGHARQVSRHTVVMQSAPWAARF